MGRLIDADAAIDELNDEYHGTISDESMKIYQIIKWLNELPSAEPERKTGHWVETGDEPYDEWECDVCGFVIDGSGCIDPEEYRDVYKFCPNCGADMRGEQE